MNVYKPRVIAQGHMALELDHERMAQEEQRDLARIRRWLESGQEHMVHVWLAPRGVSKADLPHWLDRAGSFPTPWGT